jgi:ribosome-binding factor A
MRRVNESICEVIASAISEKRDEIDVGFVTVTGVDTSPDLRQARVYISVLGSEDDRKRALANLTEQRRFLQGRIADELHIKYTPTLSFFYDETIERGMRISQILDQPEKEQ